MSTIIDSLREMLELRDAGQAGRITEKHELDIVRDARAALEAARLRGEAAQGEQQAVAWLLPSGELFTSAQMEAQRRVYGDTFGLLAEPLYTRPQPSVAPVGVEGLQRYFPSRPGAGGPGWEMSPHADGEWVLFADVQAALAQQPAAVDGAVTAKMVREALDFCPSHLGSGPSKWRWMAARINAALSTQPAPSEQVAASGGGARCEARALLRSAVARFDRPQPVAVADRQAIRMLVAAGYVSEAKANEALQIAHGWTDGELSAAPAAPAPVAGDAVAKLVKAARKVEKAIQTGGHFEVAEARTEMLHRCETVEAALAKYRASPPALYSLDADPDGIRERVADAITGALSFGAQGAHKPPAGHWLEPFWDMARAEREAPSPPAVDEATARRLDDYLGVEFDIRIGKQAAHAALCAALAQDRASQAGGVDTSTNEAWIARAESKLATREGGEA